MTKKQIRQPIVTVCGHVDHGKTSILDSLRKTSIQEGEAGGITQKISFTLFPSDKLKESCPLIEQSGIKLDIPGFLFIDTPGHAAFTNLRKRGGGLADLAVLVIDINEGIKPQTAEVIKILKYNKTPFVIALNKIDNISGWRSPKEDENISLRKSIKSQQDRVKQVFDERYMTLIGDLHDHGFEADLYYNVENFTKKIGLVPTSAETNQGLQELIMVLCGLSQKYLSDRLELEKDAKGVMLEIKTQKTINYNEAILYDGKLSKEDKIAVANFDNPDKPIITNIRILEEIQPLSSKFKPKKKVQASTGLRMQLIQKTDVFPGMPFEIYKDNLEDIKKRFKKDISESLKFAHAKQGIIAKADSLGSLEALLMLLKQNGIPVVKAGIGDINKKDVISAKANLDINELDAVIVGFNVDIDDEVKSIKGNVEILNDDVIYKLIEDLVEFREEKAKEIEKRRLMKLSSICKIKLLKKYVFRNTNPAIFGVKVLGGKMISGVKLIDENNEKVGRIKNLQKENKSIEEAEEESEVAISVPGVNYERQMKERKVLYSDISEGQFRQFKKNKDLLSGKEVQILQEIAEIKRKDKPEWGV